MDNNMVKLELTDKEAAQFVCFRRHYESIVILIDSGFFDVKNGRAIVDFSHESRIMSIDLSMKSWKRSKKLPVDKCMV